MTKQFCDICKTEIVPGNSLNNGRLGPIPFKQIDGLKVDITVNVKEKPADVCSHCVIDVINTIDVRAKTESKR